MTHCIGGRRSASTEMDPYGGSSMQRITSHQSSLSSESRRSEGGRQRAQTPISPTVKGLTSFPSISSDSPPKGPPVEMARSARSPDASAPDQSRQAALTISTLTGSTPSMRRRTALFSDAPREKRLVPGTLHHATDEHIERLATRIGAVALIRQLAEDLAQRDAQMAALQRRAEEREKVMRKMLLDCEVSNMDIEARLHRVATGTHTAENRKVSNTAESSERSMKIYSTDASAESTVDDMVGQAMRDVVGDEAGNETSSLEIDSIASRSIRQPSLGAVTSASTVDEDAPPVSPTSAQSGRSKGVGRGWIDYLWTGTKTSRKSSRANSTVGEHGEDPMATARPARASRLATRSRALTTDVFQPPDVSVATSRLRNGDENEPSDSPQSMQQPSTLVASWAVRLVAGSNRTVSGEQRIADGRHSTPRPAPSTFSRSLSASRGKPLESAQSALSKLSGARSGGITTSRGVGSLRVGPNGTIRSGGSKHTNPASSPTMPSLTRNPPTNSGPVEMDAILPPDTQPPTLHQTYNYHHPTELVTDRFGFIYDRRRKLRKSDETDQIGEQEDESPKRDTSSLVADGVASDVEQVVISPATTNISSPLSPLSTSRPESSASNQDEGEEAVAAPQAATRWQEYLKIATFPTELLSHTPAGGRMPTAETTTTATETGAGGARPQIIVVEGGTLLPTPLNPQPEASTAVAVKATFARTSRNTGGPSATVTTLKKFPQEPVRMLVEQLTDLHDLSQRERTIKWNEFLRKVRAERRREGQAVVASSEGRPNPRRMPEAALADGELIGVAGLGNTGKIGRAKWKEFKRLVLNGIPIVYRAKIWAECSEALSSRTPGYYDDLVAKGVEDAVIVAQISMDVHRTLTDNIFFRNGPGVAKLNDVLHAYARHNPDIGYCQGMNLIAASLLLIVPTAEDAFWLLTSMIEKILPPHYFDHSLLASRADQQVLRAYVAQLLPRLSAHLDELSIELEALTFQWFLSVFTGCLSAEALFRVWDVVLCTNDGSTFLFQVALALLSLNEHALLRCTTPAGVYSYINHQMTNHAISIDGLIHASDALKKVVTRSDVEKRRATVIDRELAGRRPLARWGSKDGD